MLVVGRNEVAARSVAIRRLGGKEQEFLALDEAIARLAMEVQPPTADGQEKTTKLGQ